MLRRADVPTEDLDLPDRRDGAEAAGEVLVAEDHLLHRGPQPERDHGEVDAPGPQRRNGERNAHEDREHDAGQKGELRRPVLVSDEP